MVNCLEEAEKSGEGGEVRGCSEVGQLEGWEWSSRLVSGGQQSERIRWKTSSGRGRRKREKQLEPLSCVWKGDRPYCDDVFGRDWRRRVMIGLDGRSILRTVLLGR